MSTTTNTTASSNYIDLHVRGLGYLSRVREFKPKRGESFMCGQVTAMHGEKGVEDGITYVPFDLKAVTEQSNTVLREFMAQANSRDCKVMVQFKASDPYVDTFTKTQGPNAGQIATVIKGRLIHIERLWIKSSKEGGDQSGWVLKFERPRAEVQQQQAA